MQWRIAEIETEIEKREKFVPFPVREPPKVPLRPGFVKLTLTFNKRAIYVDPFSVDAVATNSFIDPEEGTREGSQINISGEWIDVEESCEEVLEMIEAAG